MLRIGLKAFGGIFEEEVYSKEKNLIIFFKATWFFVFVGIFSNEFIGFWKISNGAIIAGSNGV